MNPKVKASPAQKHINNFFAIQARRISHEINKSNNKGDHRRDKKTTKR